MPQFRVDMKCSANVVVEAATAAEARIQGQRLLMNKLKEGDLRMPGTNVGHVWVFIPTVTNTVEVQNG